MKRREMDGFEDNVLDFDAGYVIADEFFFLIDQDLIFSRVSVNLNPSM